ncbi:hypothetical protein J3B02_003385 [Coemansia erecta]|nr:hypothetical protein J3B02_003385 [Coemansia erecta]
MCNSDNSNAPILDTQEDADNAQKQMLKFIRGLRTMLPNVKNIRLDWDCDESVEPSDFLTTIVSKMISGIIDGVKNVAYLDSENLIENISFDPDVFSGLTSFHYYFNGADKRGLDIILRNCDTLQNLTVEEMPAKFIDPMLYRENGDSIVFGCLKSLYLSYPTGTISSDTQDYKCHFPALQKLNIHGSDPIISNAVFNGTEQLEYLGLWNTYDTVDNINDQQMFKHCQLRNLKHLMLSYNCKASQVSLNNEPNKINQYSKFIGNLIKQPDCLQSLSLTSSRFETKLLYVLSTTTAFANIQRMEFTMIAMRFEDIVSVIRNCPQLNFLHCSPVNSYPSIDGIKDAELVMLLETSMYPLSKYLASVYVDFQRFWLSRETHLALALLAVGCPRLSNVNCFSAHLNTMQEGMRELADDSIFSDYRHRLQTIVAKY